MTLPDKAESPSPTSDEIVFDGSPSNRLSLLLFASVIALFIVTRLWHLTDSCLWFDEIFSVHASRHGWADMVHFVAADVIHPPLFYALLKVWIAIGGESLLWLRLFAALTSIFTILPFVLLCRELRSTTSETNLALLLMAVNGYLIKYAQEVRMYSLLLFLSLCSLGLFVSFWRAEAASKKRLLTLGAVNLLLVYTHYSGWLLVVLEAVALLLWRRSKLRLFLASVTALLLAYIPWLYEIAQMAREPGRALAQNIGWITRPHLQEVVQYFILLNKPFLFSQSNVGVINDPLSISLSFLLFGVPIVLVLWRHLRLGQVDAERSLWRVRALLFFSLGSALFVFFLSWILRYSIWGTRHLIIAAGPYFLLAALSLIQLRPYWTRITVTLVLACWFVLAGAFFVLKGRTLFIWCTWDQLAQQMLPLESNSTETVQVYAFEDLVAYHLWFSLKTVNSSRFKVAVVKGVPGLIEDPAYFLPRRFNEIAVEDRSMLTGDRIWVAFRATHWDETRPPLNLLKDKGYRVDRVLSIRAQGQEAFLVQLTRNEGQWGCLVVC